MQKNKHKINAQQILPEITNNFVQCTIKYQTIRTLNEIRYLY